MNRSSSESQGSNEGSHGNISAFKIGLLKNPGTNFGGGFNTKSGTRSADKPRSETTKFQGTERGDSTHKYGVDGNGR